MFLENNSHSYDGITKNPSSSILKNIASWQAMDKFEYKQQNEADPLDDDIDTSLNLNDDISALTLTTGILKPTIFNENNYISLMLDQNPLPENSNCHAMTNQIHAILLLNDLQQLTVEEILDHVIKSKKKPPCINFSDQILLYMYGEGGTRKIQVVKAIELRFALLDHQEELIITAPTRAVISNIGASTIHTIMSINIPVWKPSALSNAWIN